MLAHLPALLQKLYDKGVDIGAAVIASTVSAGIVAAIATAAWRWNKSRDLKHEEAKQRQQHRIAGELANQRRIQEGRELHTRLARERDGFAKAAASAGNQHELAEVWERYVIWLEADQLQNLRGNLKTLIQYPNWGQGLRATPREDLDQHRRTTEQIVRETELPPAA